MQKGSVDTYIILWLFFSRPPATVLAKPSPIKNRRESSDAEPTPPSSPVDIVPEDTVSSITVSLANQLVSTNYLVFSYTLTHILGKCNGFSNS